jgi:hypothetical protein
MDRTESDITRIKMLGTARLLYGDCKIIGPEVSSGWSHE